MPIRHKKTAPLLDAYICLRLQLQLQLLLCCCAVLHAYAGRKDGRKDGRVGGSG